MPAQATWSRPAEAIAVSQTIGQERQSSAEQKASRTQAAREKTQAAREHVDEAIQALSEELEAGQSGALVQWLNTMSRFHTYSLNHTLLIAWQRPDATHIAGFHRWKELGRTVKKGEKGMMILAPISRAKKKDEATPKTTEATEEGSKGRRAVWGFLLVYVFDVSQTEGKELPEFARVRGEPAEHLDRLKTLVKSEGISLFYKKHLGGASGISNKGSIGLLAGMPPAREFSALAHELAHELLHKDPERRAQTTRAVRETEAEAVAFAVCRGIGLETSRQHSDYIQLYSGSVDTLTASLEAIRDTAALILSAVQKG
jgi:hypothetical protein